MNGLRRSLLRVLPLVMAGVAAACGAPDDQRTDSLDRAEVQSIRASLPQELVAALDRGSTAYRRGDYEEAERQYEEVVQMDESLPAGWFGLFMTRRALGDAEGAATALERARELAPGATLLRPDEDTLP